MQYLLLVYVDEALIQALPEGRFDEMMRVCFHHADALQRAGKLVQSQQLQPPGTARSLKSRSGRSSVIDGPFAETKEILGGFNLIEAADMDEALAIARQFPWTQVGTIEVREIRDLDAERRRVGA